MFFQESVEKIPKNQSKISDLSIVSSRFSRPSIMFPRIHYPRPHHMPAKGLFINLSQNLARNSPNSKFPSIHHFSGSAGFKNFWKNPPRQSYQILHRFCYSWPRILSCENPNKNLGNIAKVKVLNTYQSRFSRWICHFFLIFFLLV